MQLGSFYPFSRNHNAKGAKSQEPFRWDSVARTSQKYLGIRYSLLPYFYTLFYKAHCPMDKTQTPSATVMRPLFFEFPTDKNTYSIDKQFMVGKSLLISPQLDEGEMINPVVCERLPSCTCLLIRRDQCECILPIWEVVRVGLQDCHL